MRSWRCELEQNAPADLVGILVAPIAEDHDAELPVRCGPSSPRAKTVEDMPSGRSRRCSPCAGKVAVI